MNLTKIPRHRHHQWLTSCFRLWLCFNTGAPTPQHSFRYNWSPHYITLPRKLCWCHWLCSLIVSIIFIWQISLCCTQQLQFIRPQKDELWCTTGICAWSYFFLYLLVTPWCINQQLLTWFPCLCRWYSTLHLH